MNDLVERLRNMPLSEACGTMDEAADRIEALEAALITEWAARDNRIEALEFELKAAKSEIEIADSVIEQKHARIEALEAALRWINGLREETNDTIKKQQARIEALEAALREIAGQMLIDEHDRDGDYEAGYDAIIRIARTALAPEQDK